MPPKYPAEIAECVAFKSVVLDGALIVPVCVGRGWLDNIWPAMCNGVPCNLGSWGYELSEPRLGSKCQQKGQVDRKRASVDHRMAMVACNRAPQDHKRCPPYK
eukprot:4412579-Amphidinium_carterae.1